MKIIEIGEMSSTIWDMIPSLLLETCRIHHGPIIFFPYSCQMVAVFHRELSLTRVATCSKG